MPRRSFQLAKEDESFLNSAHPAWEAIIEGQSRWLLLENFETPAGFNHGLVGVALMIDPGYPDTQIDMAYFFPPLQRRDGKSIPATESTETIDGRNFQRWSRHRTATNPWRPGIDDVSTHLAQVQHWLIRELPQ